jgi:hypothetical protein
VARGSLKQGAEALDIVTGVSAATISMSQALQAPVLKWITQGDLVRAQVSTFSASFIIKSSEYVSVL